METKPTVADTIRIYAEIRRIKHKPLARTHKDFVPDYWFICEADTPKDARDKAYIGDIYENAATCGECKDYVRSRNKHDYRSCTCGNVSVDGGSHYAKRSFKTENYTDHITLFVDARN